MVHSSTKIAAQCGDGYRGPRCERCVKSYYSNPTTGACLPCSSLNATAQQQQGPNITIEHVAPLLWLALGLMVGFGVVCAIVLVIQRKEGGTTVGGIFRAMDFFCYVIILLQTTLYIANDSVKSVSEVVLDRFNTTGEGYVSCYILVTRS
jgi:hypothetical protein